LGLWFYALYHYPRLLDDLPGSQPVSVLILMMTADRWQQVQKLFLVAVEQRRSARLAFLEQACAGDNALRQEVESLIEMHESTDHVLDKSVGAVAAKLLNREKDDVLAGQSIGHYTVEREIGRGGMGEVYLARDTRLNRQVALKLLPASFINDPERVRRFQQEARAASGLNHPNIVTIYEVGESEQRRFIVSEFVEGKTLREVLGEGPIHMARAVDMVMQTATALQAAHNAGIAHRDIKPENLMLRPDGYVKVLDFGLAKLTEPAQGFGNQENAANLSQLTTDAGIIIGTVRYMSPEQARGQKVDQRTDLFSLGVVLYELITGRAPFAGETTSHTIVAILEQEPAPLAQYAGEVPVALQDIVNRALSKNRDKRFQSAEELLNDLKSLKQLLETDTENRRFTTAEGLVTTGSADAAVLATSKTPAHSSSEAAARVTASLEKPLLRHPLMVGLGLPVVLFVVAALSVFWYLSLRTGGAKSSYAFDRMKIVKLSNVGNAGGTLSPDGKYIAYLMRRTPTDGLWVKQVGTDSVIQVLPSLTCWGLTFSKDSNYIYYTFADAERPEGGLYKIPVFGGPPKLVLERIGGGVSFSPDGKRMVFKRMNRETGALELLTVNSEGGDERMIFQADPHLLIWSYDWSPDGKRIALLAKTEMADGSDSWQVKEIPADGGEESAITLPQREKISSVNWLPDGNSLILIADDKDTGLQQLWQISYPDGHITRITHDSTSYTSVSLTADGESLMAVRMAGGNNLWISDFTDPDQSRKITADSAGYDFLSWTPDGRILYADAGNSRGDVWVINADGSQRQRITSDHSQSRYPGMTPDGRFIVYSSRRSGRRQIWRLDSNGNNPKQLTYNIPECEQPKLTADGQWVLYMVWGKSGFVLEKVSIDGGESVPIAKGVEGFVLSPDGKRVAYRFFDEQKKRYVIAIKPIDGSEPARVLDSPDNRIFQIVQWTKDGLLCLKDDSTQILLISVSGQPPRQLTDFKTAERIYSFALSDDGKKLILALGYSVTEMSLITDFKAR
jgi:eukaryotic-like serine/threonine-protein kinase